MFAALVIGLVSANVRFAGSPVSLVQGAPPQIDEKQLADAMVDEIGAKKLVFRPSYTVSQLRAMVPKEARLKQPLPRASTGGWSKIELACKMLNDEHMRLPYPGTNPLDPEWAEVRRGATPALDALKRALAAPPGQIASTYAPMSDFKAYMRSSGDSFRAYTTLREFAKILQHRSLFRIATRDEASSVEDLLVNKKLASRMSEADANLIRQLVAIAINAISNSTIRQVCRDNNLTLPASTRIIDAMEESSPSEGMANTFVVELNDFFVPNLQILTDRKELQKQLPGHPDPFDPKDTIRIMWQITKAAISNLNRPWSGQIDLDKEVVKATGNATGHEYVLFDEKSAKKSARQLARKLHNIKNPIGKDYCTIASGSNSGAIGAWFKKRADDQGTLLIVALAAYRNVHGTLPDTLDNVVSEGLLKVLPKDPYSDGNFHYDKSRELLWSVGINGKNDGGKGSKGRPDEPDMVWSLKPLKA